MIMPASSPANPKNKRRVTSAEEALSPMALYSAEAEKAVLGCMMAQPGEVIEEAVASLAKLDFFVPAHQEIFNALKVMHNFGKPIDAMLVHQYLVDRQKAEHVGSPGILAELLVGFATHLNVGSYIKIVKDKSLLRSLQMVCSTIVQDIVDTPDSVSSVLDRAQEAIFRVTSLTASSSAILSAQDCVREFRDFQSKVESGKTETRIKTGLACIDDPECNGGLPVPAYVVIAGQPGVGKSALVLQIMQYMAENGDGIGGFSSEMTTIQCMQRLVASTASMDSRQMNRPMTQEWRDRRDKALSHLEKLPFFIDPSSGLTPRDIRERTRRMVKSGCKMIWLDNAQLTTGDSEKKRVEQLTEVSRTIQFLQKEYNVIFILLAQITKESQKRGDGLRAFDLADCSAFHRDCRVMIMIEEDATLTKPAGGWRLDSFPILVRITKYNEGAEGDFKATFNKRLQRVQ